jgi:hypothetical protein
MKVQLQAVTEIKQPQISAAIMPKKTDTLFFPRDITQGVWFLRVGRRTSVHIFYLLNIFSISTAQQINQSCVA